MTNEIKLTIPTYRNEHVSDTVRAYDQNFTKYGHEVPIFVFDDSPQETSVDVSGVRNKVFYIGPSEKARFLDALIGRMCNENQELVKKIFRPSYGGNRNFTLVYTLGGKFISADDDMRPYGVIDRNNAKLNSREISRGRYIERKNLHLMERVEFDLYGRFTDVLGKKVSDIDYEQGALLVDNLTDLVTNMTNGRLKVGTKNVLTLKKGKVHPDATIKHAQTFRTGSADVDIIDYVDEFLEDPTLISVNDMKKVFVIEDFKPVVTNENWRVDCGVSGYDNTEGLPPFFPTKLRFEDYVFRLWLQREEVASAHVDAVQNHSRNPYGRASLASDMLYEDIAKILKQMIHKSIVRINDVNLEFILDGNFRINDEEARELMKKGAWAFESSKSAEKHREYYDEFMMETYQVFQEFDFNRFREHIQNTIDNEAKLISQTLQIWPHILSEIERMRRNGNLPVKNLN